MAAFGSVYCNGPFVHYPEYIRQQSVQNEKMREEMEHNMHEIVDACNDAAGVLGELHDDLERIAKSRRKSL